MVSFLGAVVGSSNPCYTFETVVCSFVFGAIISAFLCYVFYILPLQFSKERLSVLRDGERTGRIRAETKLRSILRGVDNNSSSSSSIIDPSKTKAQLDDDNEEEKECNETTRTRRTIQQKKEQPEGGRINNRIMILKEIGTAHTPYTKRIGTPRQGSLVPHGRGYININPSVIALETLDGIEEYSHAWILFEFHANTDLPNSAKAKVRPPRGAGRKVGQMATRSPHRPNAIGLTLVRVLKWDRIRRRLLIAALDLVNGTPVYDIKPFVPWDTPDHNNLHHHLNNNEETKKQSLIIVPDWVLQDDVLQTVEFHTTAIKSLNELYQKEYFLPFYGKTKTQKKKTYNDDDGNDDFGTLDDVMETLIEVLAQDPRASKQRTIGRDKQKQKQQERNANDDSSSSGNARKMISDPYSMIFCSVRIDFVVKNNQVLVVGMEAMDFTESTFVDGIPLADTSI